jgi:hypothetical protein
MKRTLFQLFYEFAVHSGRQKNTKYPVIKIIIQKITANRARKIASCAYRERPKLREMVMLCIEKKTNRR